MLIKINNRSDIDDAELEILKSSYESKYLTVIFTERSLESTDLIDTIIELMDEYDYHLYQSIKTDGTCLVFESHKFKFNR